MHHKPSALSRRAVAFRHRPSSRRVANARRASPAASTRLLEFWASWARKLEWMKPFTHVLEWNEPFARWFGDGELNASVNCLDRHVAAGLGERVAFFFEGEPGDRRTITYRELLEDVCRLANGLRKLGIKKGDRVAIYMPMIPELAVALLACARIGATHSVIFGGFSPDSIVDRVNDAQCVAIITADAGWRRGKPLHLNKIVDEALADTPSIQHCVVFKRVGEAVEMKAGRDIWWHDAIEGLPSNCEPERMNAEDLLFLLYTSGTTPKPGHQAHGGYMTRDDDPRPVFDGSRRPACTVHADIGCERLVHRVRTARQQCDGRAVRGHSIPDDRFWEIVERYGVTTYTPDGGCTFIVGRRVSGQTRSSSLRCWRVGELINPEAWMWYRDHIGGGEPRSSIRGGKPRPAAF